MRQNNYFLILLVFLFTSTSMGQNGPIVNATQAQTTSQTFCGNATVANLQSSGSVQWFTSATGGTALSNSTALSTGTYYVEETIPLSVENLGSGFVSPYGVAIDSDGSILIADAGSNAIKRMNANGTNISTVNNSFSSPTGVAVQSNGSILIADFLNHSIKRMNWNGSALGVVKTANQPRGVAVKPNGHIIYAETGSSKVMWIDSNGNGASQLGSGFSSPFSVAIQPNGQILVADTGNNAIKRMSEWGEGVTTLISGLNEPRGVAVKSDGTIYFTDTNNNLIKRMNADGSNVVTVGAPINSPTGIALQPDGKIVVANFSSNKIIRITEAKKLSRMAVAVTIYVAPLPTASNQTFCGSATVANLSATGTNLKWYSSLTGGSTLLSSTNLSSGAYYVSQTVNGCESARSLVNVTIKFNQVITLSSVPSQICSNEILPLIATPSVPNLVILNENFNGATNAWTTESNFNEYTTAEASWIIRPNGYNLYSSIYCYSPSSTNMYLANTITQPSYSWAEVALISPEFSTVGLLSATLSFTHQNGAGYYYSNASVEFSVNNGVDWNTLFITPYTPWTTSTINLPIAALNQPNVKIRFKYSTNGGNWWAIDQVTISGTPKVTWSPTTHLFTDAAAMTAYTSGTHASTVYVKATTNGSTTYTATASPTSVTCNTSANTTVNLFTVPNAPTASDQSFCGSAIVDNLVATGSNLKWYTVATGGTTLATTTALATGNYYVSQTVNGCESTRLPVYITINPIPVIALNTVPSQICSNEIIPLTATSATPNFIILKENFNEANNPWTTQNNSTGGTPADAAWTLRPNGYIIGANIVFNSPSATKMYIADGRLQENSSWTDVALLSPEFSTLGLSSVNLSFTHRYQFSALSYSNARVQFSVNNGLNWTTLLSNTFSDPSFTTNSVNLPSAALNQPHVKIRFQYNASSNLWWAIDQVTISGKPEVTWSPATNLFTNATATTPYTLGTHAPTVYVKAITVGSSAYTATASSSATCNTSATTTVNVFAIPTAPTASAQTFCSGATVENLVATGTNLKWYSVLTGGNTLLTSAPIATGTYYVSQTINSCESPRTAVAVTINTTTAPTASAQIFCTSATVADLVATGTAIKWYSALTGGEALATSTALVSGTYYVSQTLNACESERKPVSVIGNPIVAITSTVGQTGLCNSSISTVSLSGGLSSVRYIRIKQNLTAAQDGYLNLAELKAYEIFTAAEVAQGKAVTASGTPYTNNSIYAASKFTDGDADTFYHSGIAGNTEWVEVDLGAAYNLDYITIFRRNNCCSNRNKDLQLIFKNEAGIEILSNKIDISGASSSITYNVLDVAWADGATTLNRTGLNDGTYTLNYSDVLGCLATHSKTVVGNKPNAPTAYNQSLCGSVTVANLIASGTDLKWYDVATGGTPINTNTALSTKTYYVTQTLNGCESLRKPVDITVGTMPTTVTAWLSVTSGPENNNISGLYNYSPDNYGFSKVWEMEIGSVWVVFPDGGNTSAINVGAGLAGTKKNFRLKILCPSSGEAVYSNVVTYTIADCSANSQTANTANWTGATSDNWHTASNWAELAVPTKCTNVIINVSNPVILTSQAEAGSITLGATASVLVNSVLEVGSISVAAGGQFVVANEAVVLQNEYAVNSGLATVIRHSSPLWRLDYTLWSAPVTGQNLRAFSPQTLYNRFSTYETGAGTNGNYVQEIFTTADMNSKLFNSAKGYLIRMPNNWVEYSSLAASQPYVGSFTGLLNTGTIEIPLSGASTRLNLVGNPYPSPISIAALFSTNTNIQRTLYFWRKQGSANANYQSSGYATLNAIGFTSADPSITEPTTIQTGQGFFVVANSVEPGSLTFSNNMRLNNSPFFFRNSNNAAELHRFWLNLSTANLVLGQTLIGYAAGASQGVDDGYDAAYFNDSPTALTSLINSSEYIIQGRSLPFTDTEIVPLGFKTNAAGSYTISLSNFDGLFAESQDIYIKDNATGIIHNVKESAYSFTANEGTANDRFEVVYQNTTLTTNNPDLDINKVMVYKEGQDIVINAMNMEMQKVELYDIRGSLIQVLDHVNGTTATFSKVNIANQVVLVKITSVDNKVTTKKIVF